MIPIHIAGSNSFGKAELFPEITYIGLIWVPIQVENNNNRPPSRLLFASVKNVAGFVVFTLEYPRLRNQLLTIGYPQHLTFEEVAKVHEQSTGRMVYRKHYDFRLVALLSENHK